MNALFKWPQTKYSSYNALRNEVSRKRYIILGRGGAMCITLMDSRGYVNRITVLLIAEASKHGGGLPNISALLL